MTDAEWQSCTDPSAMLRAPGGKASDRKLRLFAAACCRLVWDRLPLDECRLAIEQGESWADGFATVEELGITRSELNRKIRPERSTRARLAQTTARLLLPRFRHATAEWVAVMTGKSALQCALLRDIIGPLFRRVAVARSAAAVALAEETYRQRTFARLPELAELLAGSAEAADHCRSPGPHVRGCWVVDELLGFS